MKKIIISILSIIVCGAVQAQNSEKGFMTDISISTGRLISTKYEMTDCAATAVVGYKFNVHLSIGEGIAITRTLKSDIWNLPVLTRFRYDILNRFCSPYIACDLGWNFLLSSAENCADSQICRNGLFSDLSIGVTIRDESGISVYLALAPGICKTFTYNSFDSKIDAYTYTPDLKLRIGVKF